jgi:hypothetical protein
LSNDQLRRAAPSIFAEGARHTMSDRYAFIPTIDVIDGLRGEGWEPVKAMQSASRLADNRDFAKHVIRFRRDDAKPVKALGDTIAELVLTNSHNGASAYNLMGGLWRLICLNGMVADMGMADNLTVRHSGNAVENVIEGSYRVIERLPQVIEGAEKMLAIPLQRNEQLAFATSALSLRYEKDEAPITAEGLLKPNRYADNKDDLWTVFNRVQENMVKGGVRGRSSTGRRMSTRAIGSVSEDIRVNRALWLLAEQMAEIKTGSRLLNAA